MQDLNDLFYFVQVVDHGGFAPAARALGEPKSKLSRRVAGLEGRLGLRLLQRSTRTVSVTEIGRAYYTRCKAMLVEAEAAEEVIEQQRSEPCGIVRMTCPVALLETRVGHMLAELPGGVSARGTAPRIHQPARGRGDRGHRSRHPGPPAAAGRTAISSMRTLSDRAQCLAAGPPLLERLGAPHIPRRPGPVPERIRGPVRSGISTGT
ncbi:MAG: LysR family transcriptional regulator [Halofilum sp. (in: g-proteobacteria)]|nr:LysR family transcriptional regulator [Halofilum sp. (in: g-proteobacteria)]